jgi:hypothetical protein
MARSGRATLEAPTQAYPGRKSLPRPKEQALNLWNYRDVEGSRLLDGGLINGSDMRLEFWNQTLISEIHTFFSQP